MAPWPSWRRIPASWSEQWPWTVDTLYRGGNDGEAAIGVGLIGNERERHAAVDHAAHQHVGAAGMHPSQLEALGQAAWHRERDGRGLHDHLGKGVPMRELFAEFLGRTTGTCKGKGGPMHLTHPETGVMVTTGIVGSSMPIANGLAWAALIRR